MKNSLSHRSRFKLAASLTVGALLFGGCLEKRLVWSPDGSRAAVIAKDGLYLCSADGTITSLLVPGAYAAAWAGDAQHLVLAQSHDLKDFAAVAAAVGQARADTIAAKAELVWRQLQANPKSDEVGKNGGADLMAEIVYLREHHGADLHKLMGKEWDEVQGTPAPLHTLVAARVTGERIELGPVLYQELAEITDLRPAPAVPGSPGAPPSAVAFVTGMDPPAKPFPGSDYRILVAPLDGSAPATLVAEHTAASPDWMADGRTLAYLQASSGGGEDEFRLGTLVQRPILDAAGRIHLADVAKDQEPVGLILQPLARVRCLKDGRIIFDAPEFHLPIAKRDQPVAEQLFVLTPGDQPTVRPLLSAPLRKRIANNLLAYFEVSPDEKQVLIAGDNSEVWLATPATDQVEQIAPQVSAQHVFSPVWRQAGEFTYARDLPVPPGSKSPPSSEVILHTSGGDTILSRTWPDALMAQFIYSN